MVMGRFHFLICVSQPTGLLHVEKYEVDVGMTCGVQFGPCLKSG